MKRLYAGRHLDFVERNDWEFVSRRCPGVVAIVATTDRDELVLIEQYREPVRSKVIELPAGLVGDEGDEGEDPAVAARRELVEETGYDCDAIRAIGRGPSSAGLTSEVVDFFLASGVRRIDVGGGVGGEQITVHVIPHASVRRWLEAKAAEGLMIDPKIAAGLWMSQR